MTNEEFEKYYREATGLNFYTYDWIVENIPDMYEDKIDYFVKLADYITLIYTIYDNNSIIIKYGRFDYNKYDNTKKILYNGFEYIGESSDLVDKLIQIIFGKYSSNIKFLLADDGEYIVTDDGKKIIL